MATDDSPKWLNVLLVIGALALGFILLKPFLTAIVFAAVVAYLFYPAHKLLCPKIKDTLSAALITALVAVLFISGIALGIKFLLEEAAKFFVLVAKVDFTSFVPEPEFASMLKEATRFATSKVVESLSGLATSLPRIILSFFIFFVTLFFFLRDGKWVWNWVEKKTPLVADKKRKMFENLRRYARSFIYVWLIIGILQGIVAAVGFYLFHLPYPLLAGIAAAIFSILPVVGPGTLYIPVGLILIFKGQVDTGVGLLIYGLSIGGFLDYVIRPYYAGRWASVHPLIILLGFFGGLFLLGPAGMIIGPVLIMLIMAVLQGTGTGFLQGK